MTCVKTKRPVEGIYGWARIRYETPDGESSRLKAISTAAYIAALEKALESNRVVLDSFVASHTSLGETRLEELAADSASLADVRKTLGLD